jgi:hypothetical protein
MRRLAVIAALVACNGNIVPYWADNDAGACVEHRTDSQYCHISPGPCEDGGPPVSLVPDVGPKGGFFAVMECTP